MRKSFSFLLLAIVISGCNFVGTPEQRPFNTPGVDDMTATEARESTLPTLTVTPSPIPPSTTPNPTPSYEASPLPSATSVLFPVLTFGADAICRAGPDKRYFVVSSASKGRSFEANGRNADGSWISMQAPSAGDACWVMASRLESPGDLSALRVLEVQPLPDAPINISASDNACGGVNNLWLYWHSIDAVGYRIYRNGKEIAAVYGNKYRDLNTPHSKQPSVYLYEIEAFNASGVSGRTGISVTICG